MSDLIFRKFFDAVALYPAQQLKMYQEKYAQYSQTIRQFEQKYQVNYEQFLTDFSTIEMPIFEKEDDGMNWEIAINQVKFCQSKIQELQHVITNYSIQKDSEADGVYSFEILQ